jgi:hypothetical protein
MVCPGMSDSYSLSRQIIFTNSLVHVLSGRETEGAPLASPGFFGIELTPARIHEYTS